MIRLWISILVIAAMAVVVFSCEREERAFRVEPPDSATIYAVDITDFHAGGPTTNVSGKNDYEENAYAVSEGQRLYNQMNCVGCHFHGGGGIGPPLMDE